MFNPKKYYGPENLACRSSYRKTLSQVKKIRRETARESRRKELREYYRFFHSVSGLILDAAGKEKVLGAKHFSTLPLEELRDENRRFFLDILPQEYETSYANPTHCVKVFGDGFGQLMSYFYMRYSVYFQHALLHMVFLMEKHNRAFIEVFRHLKESPLEYQPLKQAVTAEALRVRPGDVAVQLRQSFDPSFLFYREILEKADLSDPRYLYRYGRLVTDNEIKASRYLASYPEAKIRSFARTLVRAYAEGFRRDNKKLEGKNTALLIFPAGYERLARRVIKELKKAGLHALVGRPSAGKVNEQYNYDHRFDDSLHMSQEFVSAMERSCSEAFESCKEMLSRYSGVIVLDKFGEPPFSPQDKPECLKYLPGQQALVQDFRTKMTEIRERFLPRRETSFTAAAFPSPEIGESFEGIFGDIMDINTLDAKKHGRIQQRIIAALDRADHVLIRGVEGNRTRMTVKLRRLDDPDKQTNFVNCGADVNIPLGEVFTSPSLAGTSGTLHFGQAFLKGLKFKDLVLEFRDGYVTAYDCANFDDPARNKKYVEENLLFPHQTLPLGEFAIGTNTLAYVLAHKHGIMELLPVLIVEKMGPHFAIGDTCFSHDEDRPVFNPDGKEIVARDNEKTALRRQDPNQAYTHAHTDITLPYESIGLIAAAHADGRKTDIIRDGRFVLKGTESLNQPFDA